MARMYQYLSFDVKLLKLMNIWPNDRPGGTPKWKQWQSYYVFIVLAPVYVPIFVETISGFLDPDTMLAEHAQGLLTSSCIIAMLFLIVCFLQNAERVKKLIDDLVIFKKYSQLNMMKIDKSIGVYTKAFFGYCMIGTLIYTCIPFVFANTCEMNKSPRMKKYNIPCGIIVPYRLPFEFNSSPLYEIVLLYTAYLATVTTVMVIVIMMLVCGVVAHVIGQLKELRRLIVSIPPGRGNGIEKKLRDIIKYHIAIIEYMDEVNATFSSQLVVLITLTSFVISMLGFVILTGSNFGESLRFSFHLFGCLVIIYVISHYGQALIDEVMRIAYSVCTLMLKIKK